MAGSEYSFPSFLSNPLEKKLGPIDIHLDLIDVDPEIYSTRNTGIPGLALTIHQVGLLNPIVVRPVGSRYHLVLGYRRLLAVESLGHETIQGYIQDLSGRRAFELRTLENVTRVDLSPIEEAKSIIKILSIHSRLPPTDLYIILGQVGTVNPKRPDALSMPQYKIIQSWFEVHYPKGILFFVRNRLNLLFLPANIQQAIIDKTISLSTGLRLSRIKNSFVRDEILKEFISKGLIKENVDDEAVKNNNSRSRLATKIVSGLESRLLLEYTPVQLSLLHE